MIDMMMTLSNPKELFMAFSSDDISSSGPPYFVNATGSVRATVTKEEVYSIKTNVTGITYYA